MNNERGSELFPKPIRYEQAGRAVVRAVSRTCGLADVIKIPLEERLALDADLAAIDEAQKKGLETGSLRVIGIRS